MDETATTSAILDILSSICLTPKPPSPSSLRSHLPHVTPHSTPKSVIKRKLSNSSDHIVFSKSPKVGKRPSADPFDKHALNDRINSFTILNWAVDDPKLTPLECSVHGWECHRRKNELHCQYCNAVLLVKLNERTLENPVTNFLFLEDQESENQFVQVRAQLIESYLHKLYTHHYPGCIWKNANLEIGLVRKQYYLKLSDMDEIILQYQHNLENLLHHQEILLMKNYTFDILSKPQIQILQAYDNTNLVASMIALFGWQLKQQRFGSKNLALLKCHKCTRRILLGETSILNRAEPLNSVQYPPEINTDESEIDLLAEHESWCCMVAQSEDCQIYELVLKSLATTLPSKDLDEMETEPHTMDFDSTIALLREIN
ncbi:hypothetical protein OGAPHI_006776 [Ogataea philodendri]|uniref:C3HC-type domain-containing protein n=1 Tax=Ogataea philodendri TaxID=1378263 RepID=A0A9P8T0N3_9ASCO|nr:uncharacterized protein OGAPHI_006776 [Ogataea philodendri]KAH3661369.1 hypothetical protein OGAPHI_006776 [Ogataea philodendri]